METPLRQVQNSPTTITTRSHDKITIDTQQKNDNTHDKARIPAITSQVYDHCKCVAASLQKVHNKMILYGNQALDNSQGPKVPLQCIRTDSEDHLTSNQI